MLPPVILALAVLKLVITPVPMLAPDPEIELAELKLVAVKVVNAPVVPVILPPVINTLPLLKFVATKVVAAPPVICALVILVVPVMLTEGPVTLDKPLVI